MAFHDGNRPGNVRVKMTRGLAGIFGGKLGFDAGAESFIEL
jgi:hypothetical protein